MSKFLRTGSAESSNSSSAEEESEEAGESLAESRQQGSEPVESDLTISPLAMMSDTSPEAWLGQFLLQLELSTPRGTLQGAAMDAELRSRLNELRAASQGSQPLSLFDAGYADQLRASNWPVWWKAQDDLSRFAYATLTLSLLGDRAYGADLAAMYRQRANSRIHKDAHYVLCCILGKPWPSYSVTEADLARLSSGG